MYEIGDKVKVLKTGYKGKIVRRVELFGNVTYIVEQENGKRIKVCSDDGLERA